MVEVLSFRPVLPLTQEVQFWKPSVVEGVKGRGLRVSPVSPGAFPPGGVQEHGRGDGCGGVHQNSPVKA